MNELIQKLLAPISAEKPAGADLSYDAEQDELEVLLKGKEEIEIGNIKHPAEPPDWAELREKSTALFSRTKNLRVSVILCCSMLQTEGLPGFRDGLQLIRGLLENFWSTLYPLLDPEDNNDPTQRLNILGSLTTPRGALRSGWLTIINYLCAAPLCSPRNAPPVTFDQLQAAKLKASGAEGASADAPSLDGLGSALRASSAQLAAIKTALEEALEASQGIDQFLTNTLSAGGTISFEELNKTLREMLTGIQPYLGPGVTEEAAVVEAGGGGGVSEPRPAGAVAVSGPIRSREDVARALDRICDYYQQVEPSSPVPYLLRRAQKLVMMDFVQAVQELNLVTDLAALRPSMGSVIEASPSPPPA